MIWAQRYKKPPKCTEVDACLLSLILGKLPGDFPALLIRKMLTHELVSNYLHSLDATNSSSPIIRGIYCWPFLLWKAIIIFLLQNKKGGVAR